MKKKKKIQANRISEAEGTSKAMQDLKMPSANYSTVWHDYMSSSVH